MRNGKVVEEGPAAQIFESPREDYTAALLAAAFDLTVAHRDRHRGLTAHPCTRSTTRAVSLDFTSLLRRIAHGRR